MDLNAIPIKYYMINELMVYGSKDNFMVNYFSNLPNDIQINIINMICGIFSEYCNKYGVKNTDIIGSNTPFNKIFFNIFDNYYLHYLLLPSSKYGNIGDIVIKKDSLKMNIADISVFMIAGFRSFGCNNLYQYFFPLRDTLDDKRVIESHTNKIYVGCYQIDNYFSNRPNKQDMSIYNIMYANTVDNVAKEFSLHPEEDYVVLSPQSLYKKDRWLDIIL